MRFLRWLGLGYIFRNKDFDTVFWVWKWEHARLNICRSWDCIEEVK